MQRTIYFATLVLLCSYAALAQSSVPKPLRLAIAGLTHTHVHWILGRPERGDIQFAGIQEPNRELA